MKYNSNKLNIVRNDPCWCNSGKKYKNCHLNRDKQKPVTSGQLLNESHKLFKVKYCMHPLASKNICDRIIDAHTIQKSSTLKRITNNKNKVMTLFPSEFDEIGNPISHHIGWKKSSTFTGFCKFHDNETFAHLEKNKFTGDDKQCFLIGYRAICHELYKKKGSLKVNSYFRNNIDKGKSIEYQYKIQYYLSYAREATLEGGQVFFFL